MVGVFFANGFEEVEALTVVDLLRRANIETKMISILEDISVTGAHNIEIKADAVIKDIDISSLDAIVLPGGNPGFSNLGKCTLLMDKCKEFAENEDKLLAAICGAPSVIGKLGILEGRKAAVYPGMEEFLVGADVKYDTVVTDRNIITSRGMGTAIDFGLAIVEYYQGKDSAKSLGEKIVYV